DEAAAHEDLHGAVDGGLADALPLPLELGLDLVDGEVSGGAEDHRRHRFTLLRHRQPLLAKIASEKMNERRHEPSFGDARIRVPLPGVSANNNLYPPCESTDPGRDEASRAAQRSGSPPICSAIGRSFSSPRRARTPSISRGIRSAGAHPSPVTVSSRRSTPRTRSAS